MEALTMNALEYFINRPDSQLPDNQTTTILKESEAMQYHRSLPQYQPTPLIALPGLAKKFGVGSIQVKNEAFRFGLNAFKGLGASYAIYKLLRQSDKISTLCTATDGNHGRAVAWASRLAGKKSVIFVPKDTTRSRIDAIEREGGQVIKTNVDYDETVEAASDACNQNGWQLVQDTAWENYEEIPAWIMAGYLTLMKEMESDLHILPNTKIDIVFLQAGAGSWAGSAIWYYLNRYGKNRPKIVVVEPYEADGILESFKAGIRVKPRGNYQTIMAGLNCGIPSLIAWDIIKNGTDLSIKIRDEYAERAMRELFNPQGNDLSIISGESGAGGLAGFIALMTNAGLVKAKEELQITEKSTVLFFNTEGATDPDNFNKIIKQQ